VANRENKVKDAAFGLAVRSVKLAQYLQKAHQEFVLSKQILRSGTSVGANIEEALAGQSRNDFIAKMAIASKEARETLYWIRLLKETGYLESKAAESIRRDGEKVVKLLTAIVKSSQEK